MDSNIFLYVLAAGIVVVFIRKKMQVAGIHTYQPSEAKEKIKSNAVLLDVRTQGERSGNFIKGSLHIPLNALTSRLPELEQYRSKEIIVYCASGSRSLIAAFQLKRNGFTVGNLAGGISEWNTSNI